MVDLPLDILHMVIDQLADKSPEFGTLFSCALASKRLAKPALCALYRVHHQSSYILGDDQDGSEVRGPDALRPWSLIWRSLALSTIPDKTYVPYSENIRLLDLGNLAELLEQFRPSPARPSLAAQNRLYENDLVHLQTLRKVGNRNVVDIKQTVENFADAITTKASMLRELRANRSDADSLTKWMRSLPRLETLSLFEGEPLVKTSEVICACCPKFNSISIYSWPSPEEEVGEKLNAIFNNLPDQSLQSFTFASRPYLGNKAMVTLNRHSKSMTSLYLGGLGLEDLKSLPELSNLTSLRVVTIEARAEAAGRLLNRDVREPGWDQSVFKIQNWLSQCCALEEINIKGIDKATEIVEAIVRAENSTSALTEINLSKYYQHREATLSFIESLASLTNLQALYLEPEYLGLPENVLDHPTILQPAEIVRLTTALSKLTTLRSLTIRNFSDDLDPRDFGDMVKGLHRLRELEITTGRNMTDRIWPELLKLPDLKRFTCDAPSIFSADGMAHFFQELRPSNHPFHLCIPLQLDQRQLKEGELEVLRNVFKEKEGILEYDVLRINPINYSDDEDFDE